MNSPGASGGGSWDAGRGTTFATGGDAGTALGAGTAGFGVDGTGVGGVGGAVAAAVRAGLTGEGVGVAGATGADAAPGTPASLSRPVPANRRVNSPGACTALPLALRDDSIRPITKLCVGSDAAARAGAGSAGCGSGSTGAGISSVTASAGSGAAGDGAEASGGGAVAGGVGAAVDSTGARAASQSGNVVSPARNSLTTANPLGVATISTIRDRSADASAFTCARNRSTTSGSGSSRMCTITGRPVDFS